VEQEDLILLIEVGPNSRIGELRGRRDQRRLDLGGTVLSRHPANLLMVWIAETSRAFCPEPSPT
jgi:hypothetical protein